MVSIPKPIVREFVISVLISIFLSFTLINFNKALSESFFILHTADFILLVALVFVFRTKPRLLYPTEADSSRFPDFLVGVIGAASYVVISLVVSAFFGGGTVSTQSVFSTLASATPVLQNSLVLTFIFFGIIVPLIETRWFFGLMYEGLGWRLGIDVTRLSMKSFLLMLVISGVFTFFHLTTRSLVGVTFNQLGLALTFVFGMVSLLFITLRTTKELSHIIWLHVIVNSIAISCGKEINASFCKA